MPNPVFGENSKEGKRMKKRLTMRQKTIASKLRSHGLPVKLYRRKSSMSGVSVHDQFADLKKHARVRKTKKVSSNPQAFDTKAQSGANRKVVARLSKTKGKVKKNSKYRSIWLP